MRHTTLLVSLVLLLALLAPHATAATAATDADPYAFLRLLEEKDLRILLHEKADGAVNVAHLRGKDQLIEAIIRVDKEKESKERFDARVEAAMARKRQGRVPVTSAEEETTIRKSSRKTNNNAGSTHNTNYNNKENTMKGRAGVAPRSPTARSGKKHHLEVLYCSG